MSLYFYRISLLVVRYFRIPPQYNEQLSGMARFLYQFGVLIHFAIGFWMFSNRDIVPNESDFNDTSKVTEIFDDKLPFGDRANSFQSLIMLFGLIMMVVIYVLYYLLSALLCCKKEHRHLYKSKDLADSLSYEQLAQEYVETKKQIEILKGKHQELEEVLENKLMNLGSTLRSFFRIYGEEELLKIDAKELTEESLNEFFYKHKMKLIKSSIQGLASYNLMVNVY